MKNNKNNHYIGIANVVAALIAATDSRQDPPDLLHTMAGLLVIVLTILLVIRFFEGLSPSHRDKTTKWLPFYVLAAILISLGGIIANSP